ncbi:phosphopantetheine-binding protein [Streptomyces sp. NBC_01637]|uniref:phosphopantetheine-binding protein n=1 Tax=unclassified Streptomyces TaxID=2593676 RepID=UPI003864554B|nr:phosphopantetheine-binding protein [Streptomyces sp. NBC_01653]WTC84565.1 phosphopantetheine-binding protein [Streptomyces sp. NBC_01653]WTD86302.1 phosphopantetheine-binding protein [Streptomyces sp. NBC_01637]WTD94222.1 phosphopantetheine-binding protein [Streptomyces sp. NBC_01637]
MSVEVGSKEVRDIAQRIAEIFGEVLGAEATPATGSAFLEIGGDSLTAARAVSQISAAFGIRVTVRDLFRAGTADGLAAVTTARLDS